MYMNQIIMTIASITTYVFRFVYSCTEYEIMCVSKAGIFLGNNFKYQNACKSEFGGAISANYRGFFTISCLLFDIFRGGMAP